MAVCERTNILAHIATRLRGQNFDLSPANTLHYSELLSELLQVSQFGDQIQQRFMYYLHLTTYDPVVIHTTGGSGADESGMNVLLECIARYRKREPSSIDEQEYVSNLFLSLSVLVADYRTGYQHHFRELEGIELMIRCLKEQKYAACKHRLTFFFFSFLILLFMILDSCLFVIVNSYSLCSTCAELCCHQQSSQLCEAH
jgi:hypothetical protein